MSGKIIRNDIKEQKGWICPKCGTSVSPNLDTCPNCSKGAKPYVYTAMPNENTSVTSTDQIIFS